MKRTKDTFVFPKELGARLRELRQRAGLSQAAVALLMGRRGKKAGTLVTRLEKGHLEFPSVALLADYIRAVRGSFADVLELLDAYTSRPPAADVAVQEEIRKLRLPHEVEDRLARYDSKTTIDRRFARGKKREVSAEERVERARKMGAAWMQRRKLEAWLREALAEVAGGSVMTTRFFLSVHGRRVWGILKRTRKPRGPLPARKGKAETREELLDSALAAAIGENVAPEESLRFIHETVIELFKTMEKAGELDWLPTMLQLQEERARARVEAKRRAQKRRLLPSEQLAAGMFTIGQAPAGDPSAKRREQVFLAMQRAVVAELEAGKVPADARVRAIRALRPAFAICRETVDKPGERERRLAELCVRARYPAETRRAVDRFAFHFEQLKHRLP